jgi:hypothetical protein
VYRRGERSSNPNQYIPQSTVNLPGLPTLTVRD